MGFENIEKKQNDRNVSRTSCTFYLGKSQRGVSYIYFQVPIFLVHMHLFYAMVQHLPLPYHSSSKRLIFIFETGAGRFGHTTSSERNI
jgi:hypothetical protein